MILAVDIGNTQTVLGLFSGDTLAEHWRVSTDASLTADELRDQDRRTARHRGARLGRRAPARRLVGGARCSRSRTRRSPRRRPGGRRWWSGRA